MFDSDFAPIVTRVEAGSGVTVTYNQNSDSEGVYTVSAGRGKLDTFDYDRDANTFTFRFDSENLPSLTGVKVYPYNILFGDSEGSLRRASTDVDETWGTSVGGLVVSAVPSGNDFIDRIVEDNVFTSLGNTNVQLLSGAFVWSDGTTNQATALKQVSTYDEDTTSPLLDSATFTEKANGTIDMVLNFSEPVVRGSLRIENVNTASATTGGSSYSITADDSDNVTWSSGDRVVTVNLSRTQADGIKIVYSLGNNSLFIDVSSDLVSDFNDNPVTAISDTNRQSVTYNTYQQPITFNATV